MATHKTQNVHSSPTKEKLAFLSLRRAIFHFVPVHRKGVDNVGPSLMDEETPLDNDNTHLIQERVKSTLASTHAFDVEFNPDNITPVRQLVEGYFADPSKPNFVETSQQLARTLFTVQKGNNSPGLLAFLDCQLGSQAAVVVVKLESETGSRLFADEADGRRRYQMKVLRDLFLTEGTRVFKSALFSPSEPDIQIIACDDQRGSLRHYEVARFFLEQFLGCKRLEVGHVVTKRFYNAAVEFVNSQISDERHRNDLYDDIVSQLRRHTRRLDLKEFAKDFVPNPQRDQFLLFMKGKGVPLSFEKDTLEINSYLRKKVIKTAHDILLRIPEEASELVKVEANKITINDVPRVVRGNA